MTILVTGSAGFIGSNLVERLLTTENSIQIVGLDSVNDYYDVSIKEYRLNRLQQIAVRCPGNIYTFFKGNLADKALIDRLFADYHFDVVVNLAAQAGVRYSITNPDAYIESNLIGFYHILEACRHSSDNGQRGCNISCMPLPVPFMAVTKRCHTLLTTRSIILSVFMPLPKRATN